MSAQETLFPAGASLRDWAADGILAATLGAISIIPYRPHTDDDISYAVVVALSLGMVLPLVLRRHAPLVMLAATSFGL